MSSVSTCNSLSIYKKQFANIACFEWQTKKGEQSFIYNLQCCLFQSSPLPCQRPRGLMHWGQEDLGGHYRGLQDRLCCRTMCLQWPGSSAGQRWFRGSYSPWWCGKYHWWPQLEGGRTGRNIKLYFQTDMNLSNTKIEKVTYYTMYVLSCFTSYFPLLFIALFTADFLQSPFVIWIFCCFHSIKVLNSSLVLISLMLSSNNQYDCSTQIMLLLNHSRILKTQNEQ